MLAHDVTLSISIMPIANNVNNIFIDKLNYRLKTTLNGPNAELQRAVKYVLACGNRYQMCIPCLFPNSKIAKDSCEESSSRIKS